MLKKTGVVVALVAMVAMSALLMSCGSGSNRPSGLLYVVSQSLSNISSYALDLSSGDLSLISNDLTPTCPSSATCGLPTSIIVDPTGATALVLNQQFISGFNVNSDGSVSIDQNGGAAIPTGQFAVAMSPAGAGDSAICDFVSAKSDAGQRAHDFHVQHESGFNERDDGQQRFAGSSADWHLGNYFYARGRRFRADHGVCEQQSRSLADA